MRSIHTAVELFSMARIFVARVELPALVAFTASISAFCFHSGFTKPAAPGNGLSRWVPAIGVGVEVAVAPTVAVGVRVGVLVAAGGVGVGVLVAPATAVGVRVGVLVAAGAVGVRVG